jgi:hypothetical protein
MNEAPKWFQFLFLWLTYIIGGTAVYWLCVGVSELVQHMTGDQIVALIAVAVAGILAAFTIWGEHDE